MSFQRSISEGKDILDFYRATEHLGTFALALHPRDEGERDAWFDDWCYGLKHEGGPAVLTSLRGLETHDRAARE